MDLTSIIAVFEERPRRLLLELQETLREVPSVVLLGARQVGKTTLAQIVSESTPSIYLDLEMPSEVAKLGDPEAFLTAHQDKLVILDEVQRLPEIFAPLRGMIDRGRRHGRRTGRYLLLGSASNELMQQSETLAGRVAFLELTPFDVLELPLEAKRKLWVRGGFPDSFYATSDNRSATWRRDFVRTYLERDIPQFGVRIPAELLHRFWTMLAHLQGSMLNAADLARSMAIDGKTVARYLDLLVDLMLVRRLPPYLTNHGKRVMRSPKVYVRDSGVVHSLLGIRDLDALLGHPVCGGSWEGFVIENLIRVAPARTTAMYYRTAMGAEIDLLLEIPGQGLWAIDIKLGSATPPAKGFHIACDDVKPTHRFAVNGGDERYPLRRDTEVIGVRELTGMIAALPR
jgi:uncharacterized protein